MANYLQDGWALVDDSPDLTRLAALSSAITRMTELPKAQGEGFGSGYNEFEIEFDPVRLPRQVGEETEETLRRIAKELRPALSSKKFGLCIVSAEVPKLIFQTERDEYRPEGTLYKQVVEFFAQHRISREIL